MNLTTENILLVGSLLLLISLVVGKTSYKFGVPALLLFLGIGMLAGSDGLGGIRFDNPGIAQLIGIVSLNFILFSGGLDTAWPSVKPVLKEGLALSTLGVLLTAVSVGFFVHFITDFSIYESMLLGAIVSSTDAAAVFSILRSKSLALRSNLRPTLELESGSNDPMAYVLTIAFLSLVVNQELGFASVIPLFLQQMLLGAGAGFLFGKASKWAINEINLGFEGLYPVLVIALMFVTFSATDFVGGNGFLAIYITAVYLGNQDLIHKKTILKVYDGLAWLMQIVLFVTLGLLVFPGKIIPYMGVGLLISVFLILVARPVGVLISLVFFKMRFRRRLFISWVGLRGAVPIVFATYALLAGIDKANIIFSIVFFISITSLLIQGTTLSLFAKWLDVAVPEEEKALSVYDQLVLDLPKSSMKEFKVMPTYFAVGKRIVDLHLPGSAFIVMIRRDDTYLRPGGSTELKSHDVLMVLADKYDDFAEVKNRLYKPLEQ